MPSREKCSSRAMPTPPDCTTRPAVPGVGVAHGEGGVQAQARHRDAEAVRADQAHPVPAAGLQQVGVPGDAEAGGDHHQGPHSPFPAFPGHLGHLGRRHGHHHEVGHGGQVADRRQARHTLDLLRVRVHREQRALETGAADVEQDRPPDGPFAPAGADHRDRPRGQQRGEAGHVRPLLPARHRVQVGAVRAQRRGAGDRHGHLDHVVDQAPADGQAGVGEHPQHGGVLRQGGRREGLHPPGPAERHQMLEQQGGDPPPVHVVGDGEGDLGQARRAGGLVAGQADHPRAEQREQGGMVGVGRTADPPCLLLARPLAQAEEAQVEVVRGHVLVEARHRVEVVRTGRPDLERSPRRRAAHRNARPPPAWSCDRPLLALRACRGVLSRQHAGQASHMARGTSGRYVRR